MSLFLDPSTPAPTARGGGADLVKDSDTQGFAADVLDASMTVPVIVDFWAPWCGPCKQLSPILEKLVRQSSGLVRMVKINVDENQGLAAQLRVQSLPMVYAFVAGRPVDAFVGAQPESKLRQFISRLTQGGKPPVDEALEEGLRALENGDPEHAAAIFTQVAGEDPTNPKAIAGLVRSLVAVGRSADARDLVEGLTPELAGSVEIAQAITAIDVAEQTGSSRADLIKLQRHVDTSPEDLQARFELAMASFGSGQPQSAVDQLLEIIRRERTWNDDAARVQLIKFFDALGPAHPVTVASRKRLSSILFS